MNYYQVPQPTYGMPMVSIPYGQGLMAPQVLPVARPAMLARPITAGPVLIPNPQQKPQKPITLYVGHLTSKVKDEFFKTLLGYCGPLRSWKRVTSSFGFVEFHNTDGASRAMRILAGRTLFGKKLLINADKKTKEVIDRYEDEIKTGRVRPAPHPGAHADSGQKTSKQIQTDHDNVAVSLIQALITGVEKTYQDRKNTKANASQEADEPSSSKSRSRSASPEDKTSRRVTVLPAVNSERKRKRSRSPSKERERRKRSRSRRSRSRSERSRSRRRRKERKRRDKERRRRDSSSEPEKKKTIAKDQRVVKRKADPDKPPEPGSDDAPKTPKELVSLIPKDQSKLLKYSIDWELIDQNDLVEKTMRGWIDARIQEYLGEEEADLTNFAVGLLAHHIPPKDIVAEMEMVLVEDAEGFVVKMWRRLIFESLKIKYKIS